MPRIRKSCFSFVLVLLAVVVAGCDDGSLTGPQGEVRGVVMVEDSRLEGVTVELTGPQSRTGTTDALGQFIFDEVPSGAFVVSVRDVPPDASFPATSRTAVVSGGQSVTVDFVGNFIRTSSISGSVTLGTQGLPGVTVRLTGAQSGTRVTGSGGSFEFNGLRSGPYQVEVSGYPESVTFPSTVTNVDLSTGENRLATFEGTTDLTASVVVGSIVRRTAGGGTEFADLQNLRGTIDVTVTIDRGEDTLTSVELLVDDELVGRQLFGSGLEAAPGADGAPELASPLNVTFSVNTAAFDASTGAVRFENGPALLTARLATVEGGSAAYLAFVPLVLRNVNTFTGSLVPERGPVLGDQGEAWVGGTQAVVVRPVLYDPSLAIESVTVGLRRTDGAQLRSNSVSGTPPFLVTFPGSGTPGPANVVEYQTPLGATDQFRVTSATSVGGGAVSGVPAVITSDVRIDNVAPPAPDFRLPAQSGDSDCCNQNWIGAGFPFLSAVTVAEDGGVGGITTTIHVGGAGLTDTALAELPSVLFGGDLEPTADNTSRRAVAVLRDALDNVRISPLLPSPSNTLSNAQGAVFGIDLALPLAAFSPASVADRAVNPASGAAWVMTGVDPASGIGLFPARTTVRLAAPGISPSLPVACPYPGTAECLPTVDGLARSVPVGIEGYLTFESYLLDRAGNHSNVLTRQVLRDGMAPAIQSVQVPDDLVGGGLVDAAALLVDNVDLHRGWFSMQFEDGLGAVATVAVRSPEQVGTPFEGGVTMSIGLSRSLRVLAGVELVVAGPAVDAPTGSPLPLISLRTVATDAAGNVASRIDPLPEAGGLESRSFSVAERGDVGGVASFELEARGDLVCREGAEAHCASGTPASIELRAVARGAGGIFERPFGLVYFLLVRDGEAEWIGDSSGAVMVDGAGPAARSWTWTSTWIPGPEVPVGTVQLFAVGVDTDGNGLRTLDLGTVSVDG